MCWHRADSKQRTSLQHSDRKSQELHSAGHRRGESVWTHACWESQTTSRVLKNVARLECCVPGIRGRIGATSAEAEGGRCEGGSTDPKRHDSGGRRSGSVGAALLDDSNDRKGAVLNIVIFGGDSESLEAWRQLTEKYEPKMRTRFAGQLMSILSYSFQGDATERIAAWEREIATYERDSGKTLDDEIKDWNSVALVAVCDRDR